MESSLKKEIIQQWVGNLPLDQQIVALFEKVRDIPYGEMGSRDPGDVYKNNKGTCSGKHELLKELYNELGVETKDFIAMHKFKDMPIDYPAEIREILERSDIVDPHNFFKIKRNGNWVTVDVTWDKPLQKYGFIVNENWDGVSDMQICVVPLEIIQVDNPIEFKKERISQLPQSVQDDRKLFLKKMTEWADRIRA